MLASSGSLSANCSACARRADHMGSQLATFSCARIFCLRLTLHHPDTMLRGARGCTILRQSLKNPNAPICPVRAPVSAFLGSFGPLWSRGTDFDGKGMSDYSTKLNIPVPETFDLLLSRRSGSAKAMKGPGPGPDQLRRLLPSSARVPAHR